MKTNAEIDMQSQYSNTKYQFALRAAAVLVCSVMDCVARAGLGPESTSVPIQRLLDNQTSYLAEHPLDDAAWYRLGRIHSFAYVTNENNKTGGRNDPFQWSLFSWQADVVPELDSKSMEREQTLLHLREANRALSTAIKLRQDRGEYFLTLANLLRAAEKDAGDANFVPGIVDPNDYANFNDARRIARRQVLRNGEHVWEFEPTSIKFYSQIDSSSQNRATRASNLFVAAHGDDKRIAELVAPILLQDWKQQIGENFFRAFCAAMPFESRLSKIVYVLGGPGAEFIFAEAGREYLKFVEENGNQDVDQLRAATVRTAIGAFDKLERVKGGVSPILFSLNNSCCLKDLIVQDAPTTFDLDGTGLQRRWGWVKPGVALLVWDPERKAEITSGRQLFGNVSWWIFFQHGYEALAALDDSRDGRLAGDELKGIRAWFDRNGDGKSDQLEVVDLEELGIQELSTQVTGLADDDRSPMSDNGIRFKNGKTIPTYDWIAELQREHAASAR